MKKEVPKNKISFYTYVLFLMLLILSIFIACYISKYLNSALLNYYDFVGDVLNFSSIFTGFLGVILGILVSINSESILIKKIMSSSLAKRDLYLLIVVPFTSGMVNISVDIFYRLVLNNHISREFENYINIAFLITTIFFIFSGTVMTFIIFHIFFKQNETSTKPKVIDTNSKK